jgi:hypothetical protein
MVKRSMTRATKQKKKSQRAPRVIAGPADLLAALSEGSGPLLAPLSDMPANPATICLEVRGTWPAGTGGVGRRESASRRRSISFSPVPASPASASGAQTVMSIQLTIDVSRFPFPLLNGSISGDIPTAPGTTWRLSTNPSYPAASFLSEAFYLVFELGPLLIAERITNTIPATDASPTAFFVFGRPFANQTMSFSPLIYTGFYQLGAGSLFNPCQILFKGWQPC